MEIGEVDEGGGNRQACRPTQERFASDPRGAQGKRQTTSLTTRLSPPRPFLRALRSKTSFPKKLPGDGSAGSRTSHRDFDRASNAGRRGRITGALSRAGSPARVQRVRRASGLRDQARTGQDGDQGGQSFIRLVTDAHISASSARRTGSRRCSKLGVTALGSDRTFRWGLTRCSLSILWGESDDGRAFVPRAHGSPADTSEYGAVSRARFRSGGRKYGFEFATSVLGAPLAARTRNRTIRCGATRGENAAKSYRRAATPVA